MMMLPDPTEVMPTRNPPTSPITPHEAKDFMVGWPPDETIFNALLKQKQRGNHDQLTVPTTDLMKSFTPAPWSSRRCTSSRTPRKSRGYCQTAMARTTFRRTVL